MICVLDASAFVHVLVDQSPDPDVAAVVAREDLHCPALVDFEVTSALRGHVLGGRLPASRAFEAIEDFASMSIERYAMTSSLIAILRLLGNFTAYDASYVVLALSLDAPLVTVDAKLAEARKLGVTVRIFGSD